jgi:hypothetical protein
MSNFHKIFSKMIKKVLIVIAVAILTAGSAQAQFKFGARAGFNMTNFSISSNDEVKPKFKPGFQVGVVGDYSVSEAFAIQPGLVFATQGTAYKGEGWKETITLNYLQLPINAQYKVDLGAPKLFLQAGPYLGYAMSGKRKWKDGSESGSRKIKIGSGDDAEGKAFDFGIGVGAGVQFANIQAALGYNIGITNISTSKDKEDSMKNNGLFVTLTYLFGKK